MVLRSPSVSQCIICNSAVVTMHCMVTHSYSYSVLSSTSPCTSYKYGMLLLLMLSGPGIISTVVMLHS